MGRQPGLDSGVLLRSLRLKQFGALASGLDYVTVSEAIRQFEEKVGEDKHLFEIFLNARSQMEIGEPCPQSLLVKSLTCGPIDLCVLPRSIPHVR